MVYVSIIIQVLIDPFVLTWVLPSRYIGKFTNIHNSWLAWARNKFLKYVVERGVFMKIAEKELLQNAAVGVVPL